MFKGMKRKLMLAVLVVLAFGNALSVSAAIDVNYAEYMGYVKKFEDLVTDPLTKTTTGDATNRTILVEESSKLCSWVNNYLGQKATNTIYYTEHGARYMQYDKEIDIANPGGHLSTTMTVSTQILQFTTVYTDGLWSPDTF